MKQIDGLFKLYRLKINYVPCYIAVKSVNMLVNLIRVDKAYVQQAVTKKTGYGYVYLILVCQSA